MRDACVNSWKRRVFPTPGFPDNRHYLAVPRPGLRQGLVQGRRVPPAAPRRASAPALQTPAGACGPGQRPPARTPPRDAGSPLTGTGPRGVTWTQPSASRRVSAVSRMLPGGASCSMRAARCVVWPMAE